jgi:hypothetical protein
MTKDEALRLALEALYGFIPYLPLQHNKPQCDRYDQAIIAIKAALEGKDEPVGWAEHGVINWLADKQFNHTSFLYATPPQRTWVGLTDEEIGDFASGYRSGRIGSFVELTEAIEAKLKEKNT